MGKDGAEVLNAYGIRSESIPYATKDFDVIRKQNPAVSNAVWHTSISFAHQDKVDDKLMLSVANDYLKHMNLDTNQYLVVKHTDTQHQHMHLISNRVGFEGNVVSDRWCKNRTAHACDLMEEKYNLTIAREQGKSKSNDKRGDLKAVKEEISTAINQSLKSGISDYEKLSKDLLNKGIDLQLQKQSTGRVNGVTFKKGELIVKGSAVGKEFSYKHLLQSLEKNQAIDKGFSREQMR
jgi:Relaxase/Mobilisation nuclease domain